MTSKRKKILSMGKYAGKGLEKLFFGSQRDNDFEVEEDQANNSSEW